MAIDGGLKNLATKMIHIMSDVEYIQKTGFNQFHEYKYATEADVAAAFAKAMQKHNVFMFSSILERHCQSYQTRGNKESFLITVKLQVTFVDAVSGEIFTGIFFGDGSDPDDKGIYKAITGAQKYALMKTFLAETGDDPERDDVTPPPKPVIDKSQLITALEAKARQGTEVFRAEWRLLTQEQRDAVRDHTGVFQQLASQADQSLSQEDIPQ